MACPRCGGPDGPRPSKCPGCWDTCKAKFHEPNPCGKPADAQELLFGAVRVCQRHFDLHIQDAIQAGQLAAASVLANPETRSLVQRMRASLRGSS